MNRLFYGFILLCTVLLQQQVVAQCSNARNQLTGDLTICGEIITSSGTLPNVSQLSTTFSVDSGTDVITQANTVQISGMQSAYGFTPAGIETHNGGNGNDIFIEDRRWLSEFVVDNSTTVGHRGTFSTIQSAIDAAQAAGDIDQIFIRPGTYVEDLTFYGNTFLEGITVDGRFGTIVVVGNHTSTSPGICAFENINFQTPSGNTFTISTATGQSVLILKFCNISNTNGVAFTLNPTPGASALLALTGCATTSGAQCFNLSGESTVQTSDAQYATTLPGFALATLDDVSSIQIIDSTLSSPGDIYDIVSDRAAVLSTSAFATAGGAYMRFTAPGFFNTTQDSVTSSDVSGNYIVGTGTMQYVNTTVIGPAFEIDPAVTQIIQDWQPHGTAGTSVSAIRGTAAFDSTAFSVNNGFVELVNPTNFFSAYTNVSTTPYVVALTDEFIAVDTSTTAITVQLPNSPPARQMFTIKDITGNAGANNITITTVGGVVTFDGAPAIVINNSYGSVQVMFNGTSYFTY